VAWRDRVLEQLAGPWDLVIVGGGVTGAGILRLAGGLGWRVLLLERGDFAAGASGRSGKLVHGGLRYLAQGRLTLTRSAVRERERLLAEAPGLVRPQSFLLPVYRGQTTWPYRIGLWAYDRLAGRHTRERYDAAAALQREPALAHPALSGAFGYADARTDDARLVLRLILDAVREGAFALNYAPVTGFLTDRDGAVAGVTCTDETTGSFHRVRARVVVNAAGAWCDQVRGFLGRAPVLRPLAGSHLVFPAARLPLGTGVNLIHPRDGRPLYAFPWEGVTLVGTTDLDHRGPLAEPVITDGEQEYLLEAVRTFFPSLGLGARDIRAVFAGVRPVVGTGRRDPSRESREMFLREEKKLITVTGGKLTTFRLLALKALDLAGARLGRDIAFPGRVLTGGPEGDDTEAVPGTVYTWGRVARAATEMVVHLDDLCLRRLRLGLVLPGGGSEQLERIGSVVRPLLGWDETRWREERDRYLGLIARAYRPLGGK